MGKDGFFSSIRENELAESKMKAVRIKGKAVLLVKQGGEVSALSNRCPHEGCTFESAMLSGYIVMCPCHGWKFDVRNGQYNENSRITLQIYRCKIENGKIFVETEKPK
jgi:nitrite reductase/ring-hydroxylating ferredoxin subunit